MWLVCIVLVLCCVGFVLLMCCLCVVCCYITWKTKVQYSLMNEVSTRSISKKEPDNNKPTNQEVCVYVVDLIRLKLVRWGCKVWWGEVGH